MNSTLTSSDKVRRGGRHVVKLLFMVFVVAALVGTSSRSSSQEQSKKPYSLLPESWARESVVRRVLPTYPQEAVQQGVSGLVHIKFETSPEGEVLRIKVKPRTNSLLTKAVADAVKQWRLTYDGLGQAGS